MAKHWRAAVVVLALILAAWQAGQAQSTVGQFQIVVEPSATGAKATCVSGCAWKEVSFTCDKTGNLPCKATIDQQGVGPIGK